jgi:hypothetical protein
MQVLDTAGRPKNPGTTTDIVVGVVTAQGKNIDNTAGANDATQVCLQPGPFKWDLHATHPPTNADLFHPVYASDNHTISRLASDGSLAGMLILVEASSCYVWVGLPAISAASALAGLTATPLTGTLTGTVDGVIADIAPIATAGGATPTAAQVDTAVNGAITAINAVHKEFQATINAIISDLS